MSKRHARSHKTSIFPILMILVLMPTLMVATFLFVQLSERWISNAEYVDFPGGYAAARVPVPPPTETASRNYERQSQPEPSEPEPTASGTQAASAVEGLKLLDSPTSRWEPTGLAISSPTSKTGATTTPLSATASTS